MPVDDVPPPDTVAMSAILVAPDGADPIRKTLRHVHDQAGREQIEVILVAAEVGGLAEVAEEFPGFAALRIIECGAVNTMGEAKAVAVHAATADLVMLLEDHAYPAPGWAEALLEAWEDGRWAAVAPSIGNANPGSATSWANLFAAYGRWVAPSWSGERDALPGHNCGYRRDVMLAEGDGLGRLLDDEWRFFGRLHRDGHRFFLTSKARTDHQNISHFGSALRLRFHGGRQSASERASGWPVAKRAAHALATPLIPLIRLREVWRQIRDSGVAAGEVRRMLPALVILLGVGGLGEGVGYAFGPGDSARRKAALEHDRIHHLNSRDRAADERELRAMTAGAG